MSKHHRHYKHLHIPETWEQYWSKYPNGYSILEALIDWVSQVNKMISSFNNLSDEYTTLNRNMRALEKELRASWKGYKKHTEKTYEDFRDEILTIVNQWIATIEPTIQDEVVNSLISWLDDGTLADIINEDVFDMKANQSDLEDTNAQLANTSRLQPNGENDTENIKEYLNNPLTTGLLLGEGVFYIDEPIVLKNGDFIQGVGTKTIIKPTLDFSNGDWRGLFDIVNASDVTIKDLVLDGGNLEIDEVLSGHLLYILASSNNTFENVVFRNLGRSGLSDDYRNGPMVAIIAKDDKNERSNETNEIYSDVIGSSKNNKFKNCTFTNPDNVRLGFAVRVVTSWNVLKPLDQYVHTNENNTFDNCDFFGNWYWDTLEIAGGGTIYNKVLNSHFEGGVKTAIDFDKGASYNTASNNTVIGARALDKWIGDGSIRVAAIHVHALAAAAEEGFYSSYNNVLNNRILNTGNLEDTDQNKSAISVGYAKHTLISGNVIDGLNAASGRGIFIDHRVSDVIISENTIVNGFSTGIYEIGSSTTGENIVIEGNNIELDGRTINVVGDDISVVNNDLKTKDDNSYSLQIINQTNVIIVGNKISGGSSGMLCRTGRGIIGNNLVTNSSTYAYRVGDGTFYMNGNVHLDANDAINILYGASVIGAGNSFQSQIDG